MSKRCNEHTPTSHPCNLPSRHPVDMHECAGGKQFEDFPFAKSLAEVGAR